MALVHGEDLMKLYALAVERAPARSNRVGAGINGLQSGRARATAGCFCPPWRLDPQIVSPAR
jgi:hypothetical protein